MLCHASAAPSSDEIAHPGPDVQPAGPHRREVGFGSWEQILYGKSDGWRATRVLVKVIGE